MVEENSLMTIQRLIIDLPETAHLPAGLENDQDTLREAVAIVLYKQHRLTLREARDLMGVSRRDFEERMAGLGFSMMDERDLQAELDASRQFSA